MEWSIPIQKLELGKIHPGSLQTTGKALTPLEYRDGPFALKHVNILLPPLAIREYDAATGKLALFLPDQSAIYQKLLALQESLLLLVHQHQKTWFPDSHRTKDQIQHFFQPFVEGNILQLYCPLQTSEKKYFFSIWKDNIWSCLTAPGVLQKGDVLRVALRLHGISYQTNPQTGSWTGRFRIQHKIMCMYHCGTKA